MANSPKTPTLFLSNSSIRQDVKSLVEKDPTITDSKLTKIIDKALTGTCSNTTQTRRKNVALGLLEEVRSEVVTANNRITRLAKRKEWRANNKEKISEANKKYYIAHKERIIAYGRQWRANNKEKIKAYVDKVRAKKLENNITNITNNNTIKNTNKQTTTNVKNNNNINTNNTKKNTNKQTTNVKNNNKKTNKTNKKNK
jgi:hypothetical protein